MLRNANRCKSTCASKLTSFLQGAVFDRGQRSAQRAMSALTGWSGAQRAAPVAYRRRNWRKANPAAPKANRAMLDGSGRLTTS